MLRRVALVRTDVSEERIAYIISVTRIGELGKTLAVTSISSQRDSVLRLLVTSDVSSSPNVFTLIIEALSSPKRRFLQASEGVISQKTTFFMQIPVHRQEGFGGHDISTERQHSLGTILQSNIPEHRVSSVHSN
jgi:hypothetical protein